jgi:PAS domain S-box-containing protein
MADLTSSLETILRGGHIGKVESDACKSIGILVVNSQGRIVYANEKMTSLFHFSPRELIGERISILMHADAAERHERWFRQWWDEGRQTKEMMARSRIVGRDRNGEDVALAITISETLWYDEPAALATILPSSWSMTEQ